MEQNPTKKCSECQMDISIKAKKCPHCQSKVKQPTSPVVKLLGVLMIVGIFSSVILSSTSGGSDTRSKTNQPTTKDYQSASIGFAEPYIEKILKAPTTADFCRGTSTDLGDKKWEVSSCVDSENSYGAMIRSNWQAVMVHTGNDPWDIGSWKPEKITFDGKVVYKE